MRSDSVSFGHSLLDEADDDHEDGAAHSAASHLANQATDIKTARLSTGCRCGATDANERAQDLPTEATPDDPRDGVAESAETLLFQHISSDVAIHSATNQADDQSDDPVHVSSCSLSRNQRVINTWKIGISTSTNISPCVVACLLNYQP